MESAARILHRITLATAGLALIAALAGHGGPEVALIDRVIPAAPAGGPLTISSPAFADGAPIPVLYTCKGTDTSPPLTWSAPLGGALVVDDLDAPGGTFIHWVVIGIAPGSGSIVDGRTPPGGVTLPNSTGQQVYSGPCPPPGSGVHHYRFTLYQLPNDYQLPGGLAGLQAAQAIAGAANAQAQLIGTFGS